MSRFYSPQAIKLAKLLRDMNPDIKLAPALERAIKRKPRTVDVVMPSVQSGKTAMAELDRQVAEVYPDLPRRG